MFSGFCIPNVHVMDDLHNVSTYYFLKRASMFTKRQRVRWGKSGKDRHDALDSPIESVCASVYASSKEFYDEEPIRYQISYEEL